MLSTRHAAAARGGSRRLRAVILVGHSYGGMVITGVADRAIDRVGHLGVTNPDDVARVVERLTPHPWRTTTQPLRLTNEAALWALPQTHICCTASLPIRDVERIKEVADGRLWDIDTGHDLMITEPPRPPSCC